MAVVQIITPNGSRSLELPEGLVTVGRSGDNDIVLEDKRSSRRHCTLQPVGGGYVLRDCGSRNGTAINGQPIAETFLAFGGAFCIGKTILRIFEESVPPVEIINESEAANETIADAPVAQVVNEDAMPLAPRPETIEDVFSAARRDLNNLRTAGTDPGFSIDKVTFLNSQSQAVHAEGNTTGGSEAVRTLRLLFYGAFRTRATDMHFDPLQKGVHVRFRVDGKLLPVVLLPTNIGRAVLSVVKVMSELNIAGRKNIQDGSFSVMIPRRVDIRVSLSPTMHGEKLVMRVLDTGNVPHSLHQLGLSPSMLKQIQAVCHLDSGMMIVSGPTGSGKTTTLYTALRTIDSQSRNVVTIENPIEYHVEGITQIQTDDKKGLTFSHILKSTLRQDPDVILIGEMRDQETAQTALQAAMTGHLVFSTLHARDTIGSIFRLLDLGVEPYMVANSVSVLLAQRLVRVLCSYCRKPYTPKPSQLVKMGMANDHVGQLYAHVGCRKCMGVGFWGRAAIFELLAFNDDLRDALMTTQTIHDIRRAAGEWNHQTLLESGYKKVVEGATTVEEVERVAAPD